MIHQTNRGQNTGLPQTSVSHMYPRIYSGVGRVYCNYCRTFLMTEAKRKTKQICKFNHVLATNFHRSHVPKNCLVFLGIIPHSVPNAFHHSDSSEHWLTLPGL